MGDCCVAALERIWVLGWMGLGLGRGLVCEGDGTVVSGNIYALHKFEVTMTRSGIIKIPPILIFIQALCRFLLDRHPYPKRVYFLFPPIPPFSSIVCFAFSLSHRIPSHTH